MTTLLLLFHSDYEKSKANRALAEAAAAAFDDVTVAELGGLYAHGGEIDLDAEVARLLTASRLILQFPINWYSTPPLLKAWQDRVLTRMYYIRAEEEGDRLRDLPMIVAATAGNVPEAYHHEGVNLHPLPELLKPLQSTAHRCGWLWGDPFLIYRANRIEGDMLAHEAARYIAHIEAWRAGTVPLKR